MLSPIRFDSDTIEFLDQRRLPLEEVWLPMRDLEDVIDAIKNMAIRGAPAIACAAAFGIYLHAKSNKSLMRSQYFTPPFAFASAIDSLIATRPTAVNMQNYLYGLRMLVRTAEDGAMAPVIEDLWQSAVDYYNTDIKQCVDIGIHGADTLLGKDLRVLTHCNAGALATAGYGTALGIVRALWERKRLKHVYVDETRPWLQGSRLTAYELASEGIPYSVQVESAVGHLMSKGLIDVVIVGADRIATNGDVANKVGTYNLAVLAKYHKIPFVVAAPTSTIDPETSTGQGIIIEYRDPEEITYFRGHKVALDPKAALNPSFDVTPASLVTHFVTEIGILKPPFI